LLKAEGYDVVGVTLQLYDHGAATHRPGACCAGQDIHDARMVAAKIGIPHYVLDYESRFKQEVIDRFAESYVCGETPVPCVDCNQAIKFRDLLVTARELGAKVLATGHYVASRRPDGTIALYRLRGRPRPGLSCLPCRGNSIPAVPLGDRTKAETLRTRPPLDLPVAEGRQQDICFVPAALHRRHRAALPEPLSRRSWIRRAVSASTMASSAYGRPAPGSHCRGTALRFG
jgi:tRNA-specific 2-thiouridylase